MFHVWLQRFGAQTISWDEQDPKSHLMEDHDVEQQQELKGFVDLGEDFPEQNYQDQAKAD
jgi:hypothetical protein